MSGYAVVFSRGCPIDAGTLQSLAGSLQRFAPDGIETHRDDLVGIAAGRIQQGKRRDPLILLADDLAVTGEVRLDRRATLKEKLGLAAGWSDLELVLLAYRRWGTSATSHLAGDFSFVIVDRREKLLFAARDHFGVAPLYYVESADCIACSNSIDALRTLPFVSSSLNESAIGDFLLFSYNQDVTTTVFEDIRRVPPAHLLESRERTSTRRYWALQPQPRMGDRPTHEVEEEFRALMRASVGDRVRGEPAAVFMSGGLDSTTVAAFAARNADVKALTVGFSRLVPRDREVQFAAEAARYIGARFEAIDGDRYRLFDRFESLRRPEPVEHPLLALLDDQSRLALQHSKTVLRGDGSDPAFAPTIPLTHETPARRVAADLAKFWFLRGRPPAIGVRTAVRRIVSSPAAFELPAMPSWLEPSFAARCDLAARWAEYWAPPSRAEGWRPAARRALTAPYWSFYFESLHPSALSLPLQTVYPFFDLELIHFLTSLPTLPWCSDKLLIRRATKGLLPEVIRWRPKTPLPGDQIRALVREAESEWIDRLEPDSRLMRFVDRRFVQPSTKRAAAARNAWMELRPLALNFWLKQSV